MTRHTPKPVRPIKLSMTNEPFTQLVSQWKRGTIDPNPPYQRAPVWTLDQKIALIESLVTGTPVPAIITNRRGTGMSRTRYVIDGKQRLTAFREFLDDEILVPVSWFGEENVSHPVNLSADPRLAERYGDDGLYVSFSNLSDEMQALLDNVAVPVAEGHFRTVEQEAALYCRVNGYGTPQTKADLERALRIAAGEKQ